MSVFLLKRFTTFVATLLAASVLIFWVLEVLPGNAAQVMLGRDRLARGGRRARRQARASTGRRVERYLDWMRGLLTGDLGVSFAYDTPVWRADPRAPVGEPAAGGDGDGADHVLALALGVYAASRHNQLGDVA